MKNLFLKIALISLMTLLFNNTYSQTDSLQNKATVIVEMNNGDEYTGQVVSKDKEFILLKTVNGEIKLIAENVKSIENNEYTGEYNFASPNKTRYFFGPTGIPLKKGKGYYQNVMVTTNFVNVGITDNLSIGGGFEFVSTITGNPIWFLSPKIGVDISENVHVAGGVIMVGLADEGAAALGFGVFTLGHSESNVTLGAGFGLVNGEVSNNPTIMISGFQRVSNSIGLLTENYILPNDFGNNAYFGIHGIRILSKKSSFDIGAIVLPEISFFIAALPFVGFVRTF